MYSCYSILECYNLFSRGKLSVRSFSFISSSSGQLKKALKRTTEKTPWMRDVTVVVYISEMKYLLEFSSDLNNSSLKI